MPQIFPSSEPSKGVLADMTRIVMRWAHIESAINTGICAILKTSADEQEGLIAPIRNFRAREQIFRNLLEIKAREAKNDLAFVDKLFTEITYCYDTRNKIAHSRWLTFEDEGQLTRILQSKDKQTREFSPILDDLTFEEIQKGAQACFSLLIKLSFLIHNLRGGHPPFGNKYPELGQMGIPPHTNQD